MRHASAFLPRLPELPEWDAFDVARTLIVGFCAFAYICAGHLPAL